MIKFEDLPVKLMIYPAVVFFFLGLFFGTFISFNAFVMPDYFSGEYVHFGRVRPVHVLHVTVLWLLSVDLGLVYYMTQRLCGVPLWSRQLALWSCGIWWFSVILGTYSIPAGTNFGWEYAELPTWIGWIPIKALSTVAFLMVVVNIFMTIARRKYQQMYVSLWYIAGTMIWTSFTYVVGNFGINWIPGGISKVNTSFFYVHNLVGLVFTPMGLAAAYYFLPKLTNTPIYSHRLSMVGFWSIAFVYAWIGAHHIVHGPMSQWLQTVSIVFSLWLFIPVFTVVTNLFATMRGQWEKYNQSAPLRFLLMGNLFYLMTCIQGPLMAVRNINEITSKTDWVIGHSHISLFGTFTFFAIAGVYWVLPVLTQKPIWSKRLADWHFSLTFTGAMLMFLSLHIGGFLQGLQWADWANGVSYAEFHNNLSKWTFLQSIDSMYWYWVVRGISGLVIMAGSFLFLVNVFNTVLLNPRQDGQELQIQRATP